MAFPNNGVLDNFNRANNSGPPSASWAGQNWYGDNSPLKVSSNQCAPSASFSENYWNTSVGPDTEVYCTLVTVTGVLHWIAGRLQGSLSTGSPNGYAVRFEKATSALILERLSSGGETQLGASFSQTVSAGDALGMTIVGSTLTLYYKASGGSWTSLGTRSDATYASGGFIGLELSGGNIDDFGGGTVSSGTTFTQTVSAASNTSAGVAKQGNKILSATSNTVEVLTKQGQKILSTTKGNSATLTKQGNKTLSASQAGSAGVAASRTVLQAISATVTGAASLVKQAGKILSATQGSGASQLKRANKAISASTATGAALVKQVNKTLSAGFSLVLTVLRNVLGLPPLFRASATVTAANQASSTLDITQASTTLSVTQASSTLDITQAGSTVNTAVQAVCTVTQGTQAEATVTYYGN